MLYEKSYTLTFKEQEQKCLRMKNKSLVKSVYKVFKTLKPYHLFLMVYIPEIKHEHSMLSAVHGNQTPIRNIYNRRLFHLKHGNIVFIIAPSKNKLCMKFLNRSNQKP